jgi:hypothetical protein
MYPAPFPVGAPAALLLLAVWLPQVMVLHLGWLPLPLPLPLLLLV